MWQREQKSSINEPDPLYVTLLNPMLNIDVPFALANGLILYGCPVSGLMVTQSMRCEPSQSGCWEGAFNLGPLINHSDEPMQSSHAIVP